MTINVNTSRNEYTATSGQTVFNFTFKIYTATDLNVYVTPAGQECNDVTDLTEAYTVTGVGLEDGGSITLNTGAGANDLVTIVSAIPSSRTTDYQSNGDFTPETVNNDIDRAISLIKQVESKANRSLLSMECLQGPKPLTLPKPESGDFMRWKTDLSGLENVSGDDIASGIIVETDYVRVFDTGYVKVLDTVAEMVADTSLVVGQTVRTKGYNSAGDGGGNEYEIVAAATGTDDGGTFIDLNTHQAQGLFPNGISVRHFGAVGDGVADDTAAIQAAIDYAENLSVAFRKGGSVYVPPGEYLVSSPLTIQKSQIEFFGAGAGTQFTRVTDYGDFLTIADADPDNVLIRKISLHSFYVLHKTVPATTGSHISITRADQVWIDKVYLQGSYNGITVNGCANIMISNIHVESGQLYSSLSAGSYLIAVNSHIRADTTVAQSASIYISNSNLRQDTAAAYVDTGLLVKAVDGLYVDNTHIGFANKVIKIMPGTTTANIQHVYFNNGYIDGNVEQSDILLTLDEAASTPHTGVYAYIKFSNCSFVRPNNIGVLFRSTTARDIGFINCSFVGGNGDGIQASTLSSVSNVRVSSCYFSNWNRDTVDLAWDVRLLPGNTCNTWIFSGCEFTSTDTENNVGFAGSEDDIKLLDCNFSKSNLGGSLVGKTITIDNPTGLTSNLQRNSGETSVSPDANGNALIPINLYDTPSYASVSLKGDSVNEATVQAVGSVNITVRIRNSTTNADVTTGSYNVFWEAKV